MECTHALQVLSMPVKRALLKIRHPCFKYQFDSNIAPNDVINDNISL